MYAFYEAKNIIEFVSDVQKIVKKCIFGIRKDVDLVVDSAYQDLLVELGRLSIEENISPPASMLQVPYSGSQVQTSLEHIHRLETKIKGLEEFRKRWNQTATEEYEIQSNYSLFFIATLDEFMSQAYEQSIDETFSWLDKCAQDHKGLYFEH